jgi:hypothetical protein
MTGIEELGARNSISWRKQRTPLPGMFDYMVDLHGKLQFGRERLDGAMIYSPAGLGLRITRKACGAISLIFAMRRN